MSEYENIANHTGHDLAYHERGFDIRDVHVDNLGNITIGKSRDWDCDLADIWCNTCNRYLDLDNNEWEYTV